MNKFKKIILPVVSCGIIATTASLVGYQVIWTQKNISKTNALKTIKNEMEQMANNVVSLENQIERVKTKVLTIIAERNQLKEQLTKETANKEELGLQLYLKEQIILDLKNDITNLIAKKTELEKKVKELESKLSAKDLEILELNKKQRETENIRQKEKSKLTDLENLIDNNTTNKKWLLYKLITMENQLIKKYEIRNMDKHSTTVYKTQAEIPRELKIYYEIITQELKKVDGNEFIAKFAIRKIKN